MTHLAAHAGDDHTAVVTARNDVARHAETGDEERRATGDDGGDVGDHALGHRREQVDAERRVGELAHLGDLLHHLLRLHRRGAERSDAAGVAHGGDEPVVRHTAHPREHHRVLDLEQVGQPCSQHQPLPSDSSHPTTPMGG